MANNPIHKKMIDRFDEWFSQTHSFRFTWSIKEVTHIDNLYKAIAEYKRNHNKNDSDDDCYNMFYNILELIPRCKNKQWLMQHACPSVYYSQFNAIIAQISDLYVKTVENRQTEISFDQMMQ